MKHFSKSALASYRVVVSTLIAVATMTLFSSCLSEPLTYAPWTDLSQYFDLERVEHSDGQCSFNSYTLSQGKEMITSKRIDDHKYNATVLGKNVWVRSSPTIARYTQRCQVNTGDHVTVLHSAGYENGKYWSYVYVNSGRRAGNYGYICSDFIIEQQKYEIIQKYILSSSTNITLETESKYLNAIADVLLKFNVNVLHQRLFVSLIDSTHTGDHLIVTFRIQDIGIQGNNSMLAVIQFTPNTNDYVVIGIVPGYSVGRITRLADGSCDVNFNPNRQ